MEEFKYSWLSAYVFCALSIFFFHTIDWLKCDYGILHGYFARGALCMTGFFILSGFALTTSHYDKKFEHSKEYLVFYKKRILSLFPSYWILLTLYLLIFNTESLKNVFLSLPIEYTGSHMFFENMFHFLCNGGTWFITCFILCYFVFPLLLGIFRELTAKTKVRIFCVITLFLVYAPVYTHMMKIPSIYSNPTFRMMEFALGVIIALMKKEGVVLKLTERQKKMSIYFGFVLLVLVANAFGIIGIESFDNYSFYDCIAIPIFSIILFMGGVLLQRNFLFWHQREHMIFSWFHFLHFRLSLKL